MFMRMIYDDKLAQAAYLIGCQKSGEAIIFDPERDIDRYQRVAEDNGLRIVAAAETHIHADFVSGAREFAERGAKVYVSAEGGADWQSEWLDPKNGGGAYRSQKLRDGDSFQIGKIEFRVVHTPGHTPEHIVYLVIDHAAGASEPIGMISGDFLFVGDLGRPDLLETAAGQVGMMEPSARRLFHTLKTLDRVADFVQVWPAHGAGSACGKALGAVPMSTIGYERRFNPAIRAATSEGDFVNFILKDQPEPPLYFSTMKRVDKIGPRVLGDVPRPPRVSASDLLAVDGRKAAIIDTRMWGAFREGHIPGSLSFPLSKSFNTDAGSMILEDESIYLLIDESKLDEAVRDLIRVGLDHFAGWAPPSEVSGYAKAGGQLATLQETDVSGARQMLERGGVNVLDVRRAAEFAEGNMGYGRNIAHTRLRGYLSDVPKDKPLLVHCRSGARSARACALLQRQGYRVTNLKGGYLAWEAATGGR